MKKLSIFLIIFLAVSSCKKEETITATPRLKNCRLAYLLFFEDPEFLNTRDNLFLDPSDTLGAICTFTYEGDNITKISGGYSPFSPLGLPLIFNHDYYDSIHFDQNKIYTYSKFLLDNSTIQEVNYNPTEFTIDSEKRIAKLKQGNSFRPSGFTFSYTYSDQMIKETNENSQISRIFNFEGNNLIKVVKEYYDPNGSLGMEDEFIFKDFDNKPNPFKNMYYVKGAFFRAFSENNYKSYSITRKLRMQNGLFELISTYNSYPMSIEYRTDGYPKFGDYEQ